MTSQSNIERVVMRRLAIIRAVRPFFSSGAMAVCVFLVALYAIGREVWVARVLENAPTDVASIPQFYLAAFAHTDFIVQVLTVLTLVSLIYLAREAARGITSIVTLRHA